MSHTEYLRAPNGTMLGRIVHLSDTRVEVRDPSGMLKGWYNPKTNQTFKPNGSLVATGNMLNTLL